MANVNEIATALKYQLEQFINYIEGQYLVSPSDIKDVSHVWHIEPFDIDSEDSLKKLISAPNYGFVITNVEFNPVQDSPTRYIKGEFTADVYVIRKTLSAQDVTNKVNLVLNGGTDGAGNVITSMSRICGDIAKWFIPIAQGGKLEDLSGNYNAFRCDIQAIPGLFNTGSFYWKRLSFRALSMESTTISAS